VAERPDVPRFRFDLAKTAINLAILFSETGRQSQAESMLNTAKEILEKLNRDHPKVLEYREPLAEAVGCLGKIYRESGHITEAMLAYQRARKILEDLPYLNADELYVLAGFQAQCAALVNAGGDVHRAGNEVIERPVPLDEAMETLRRAFAASFQNRDRLRRDTDLDPLRSRADFQMLTMDLAFPVDPFSP
jgi:eukaryotic-like serine/threonine-protein kinase